MEDRRDHSTRDMTIESRTMIDQHMKECASFREGLNRIFSDIRLEQVGFRSELKVINNRMLLIIGGLIVVGKAIDWGAPLLSRLFHP